MERIGRFLCENQKKNVNEILTKSYNAFGERCVWKNLELLDFCKLLQI